MERPQRPDFFEFCLLNDLIPLGAGRSLRALLRKVFYEALARFGYSVIPAKAGIQNSLKTLVSGSPPASAGVARNDNFLLLAKFSQESLFSWFMVSRRDMNNCG
jgi:hypothetical protein